MLSQDNSQPIPKIQVQQPNLPKGGGAMRGISDSFKANSFTGTAGFSIPIPVTNARGFEPNISLDYSSGTGNSPYGLGFSLSQSSICVKTERGIPQYNNTEVYVFQSEGELVKKTNEKGHFILRKEKDLNQESWDIFEYIPRVQGAYSRIEKWVNETTLISYWKVTSSDCVTTIYGKNENGRIASPENPDQIYEWLPEESTDDKGNKILYNYKREDDTNVPKEIYEQNRSFSANRYLSRIQYGNYLEDQIEKFAFEIIFDYGEYQVDDLKDKNCNPYIPVRSWACRPDPYSSYKSGFEIRTYRLCQNILLFHLFEKELGKPCLVRKLSLTHTNTQAYPPVQIRTMSLLKEIVISGCRRKSDGSYDMKNLPPVSFDFSLFTPPSHPEFKSLSIEDNGIPGYLNATQFQPLDLKGEGMDGFLLSNDITTLYFEPLGGGRYSAPQSVELFPISKNLQDGTAYISDIDGNGKMDLIVTNEQQAGYYSLKQDGNWDSFQPFLNYPLTAADTYREMVDLDANGKTDLLQASHQEIRIFSSNGYKGYKSPDLIENRTGLPILAPGAIKEKIGFADLFGDGLSHRIRIRSGLIECWPNLGHGNFGTRVCLGNAPVFDNTLDIDRLFLSDITGDGTADLVYVYDDKIVLFLNENGNSFSAPVSITLPEPYSDTDQISFMDVLGNGTNCLVFSKMTPTPIHYYYEFNVAITSSLTNEKFTLKPFLLTQIKNDMGAFTEIKYCSAIKFMLEDKLNGRPWPTRLRFPVQVVEEVTIYETKSRALYTQRFRYHDGYYDPDDREFRGFGFVETWDTQTLESFEKSSTNPDFPVNRINKELYIPPTYTKAWYNTGAFQESAKIMELYKKEFFKGDPDALKFPDSVFDRNIYDSDSTTLSQAYAALKGRLIRQEIYADDNSQKAQIPYIVTAANFQVLLIQPATDKEHGAFKVNDRESISYSYERDPTDPLVCQSFILETDPDSGSPIKTCSVFLSRRASKEPSKTVYPEQQELKITLTKNLYAKSDNAATYWYRGILYDQQEFQLTGFQTNGNAYFSFDQVCAQANQCLTNIIPYLTNPTPNKPEALQLSHSCCLFWNQDLTDSLPPGKISYPLLAHHSETDMFTQDNIPTLFGNNLTDRVILDNGGYLLSNTGYWQNKGLVQYYDKARYYLSIEIKNSFADTASSLFQKIAIEYDRYSMRPVSSKSFLSENKWNESFFETDYQSMQSNQMKDINGNYHQVIFDPLGEITVSSVFGKENGIATGGMRLFEVDKQPLEYIQRETNRQGGLIQIQDVVTDPEWFLQGACSFFFYNWDKDPDKSPQDQQPVSTILLKRLQYNNFAGKQTTFECQHELTFYDGMGRQIEKKIKTVAGDAFSRDAKGRLIFLDNKPFVQLTSDRWIVSERVVYNNKGKVCEQYLPFFIDGYEYESQQELVNEKLVPPPTITHYDPLLRIIGIDTSKGFFTKVDFTPWEQIKYDEDDTVIDSDYYIEFIKSYPVNPTPAQKDEKEALDKAAAFFNTPTREVNDNAGRKFLSIANNLGKLGKNAFGKIVEGSTVTSEEIWNELNTKGYIDAEGWVTYLFKPYTTGFALKLVPKFASFVQAITDLLRQNCLTTYSEYDISGRLLRLIDPRLYYSNITKNTSYSNFIYAYPMQQNIPSGINSADAGTEFHLVNIYGNQTWSMSGRGYNQVIIYDQLQRKTELRVKQIKNSEQLATTDYPLVEIFQYGESLQYPETGNLRGKVYQINDLSGIQVMPSYSMQGQILKETRQLITDYKNPPDWNDPSKVELEKEIYENVSEFNALKWLTSNITPDGTLTSIKYSVDGLLRSVDLLYKDSTSQKVVTNIEYNANCQRLKVNYGNNVNTVHNYEDSTQRLLNLKTTRQQPNRAVVGNVLQDITYVYDPVGNITRIRDGSQDVVFNNNQKIEPKSDYGYDAIYRLTEANGRQHPGILSTTYQNNVKDGDFKQSKFSALPSDESKLENYSELYSYDDSSNLIKLQHTAASASWTRDNPVADDSNRLKDLTYDESGNMRQIQIDSTVSLSFNCCENLVKAGIIKRPDEPDDTDYYNYDSDDLRTRKVCERLANGGNTIEIEEKIYLGNYEIKRIKKDNQGIITTSSERQCLRIFDDEQCVLTIYFMKENNNRFSVKADPRELRWQLSNNIGSITMELSSEAELISYEEYYPFGETSIVAGNSTEEVSSKEYRYSGKERDDSTGLYYYGARYYVSWLGRWLNPDPAGTVDGPNLYQFVGNNPIGYADSNGLMKKQKLEIHGEEYDKPPTIANMHGPTELLGIKIGMGMIGGNLGTGIENNLKIISKIKQSYGLGEHDVDTAITAIGYGLKGDKANFDYYWHAAQTGMDEHLSTITVFYLLKGIGSTIKNPTPPQRKAINLAFLEASTYRMRTTGTGYSTDDGKAQHTTSTGAWSSSGDNHPYWDRMRRNAAITAGQNSKAKGLDIVGDMLAAAAAHTVNFGVQPAISNNAHPLSHVSKAEILDFSKERESIKHMLVATDRAEQETPAQSASAAWEPALEAPLSPPRKTLSKQKNLY